MNIWWYHDFGMRDEARKPELCEYVERYAAINQSKARERKTNGLSKPWLSNKEKIKTK